MDEHGKKSGLSWRVLLLLLALLFAAGCANTPESDLPWANPGDFEGSPTIPGFSNQR